MPVLSAPVRRAGVIVCAVISLALAVAVGGVAARALEATNHDDGLRRLQVVVLAHPDDVMLALPALVDDPTTYTVTVVMTHGERTGHCRTFAKEIQPQWGELVPSSMEKPGAADKVYPCLFATVLSWRSLLGQIDGRFPALHVSDGRAAELSLSAPGVAVPNNHNYTPTHSWKPGAGNFPEPRVNTSIGSDNARLMADVGDGDITADEVRWAVEGVLALRGHELPDLPLDQVVAGAYWNDSPSRGRHTAASGCDARHRCPGDPRALESESADALAVVTGVTAEAHRGLRGSLVVTSAFDPNADETHALSLEDYDALMALGPRASADPESLKRVGAMQTSFGWLAWPRSYWVPGDDALAGNDVVLARVQHYRRVSPSYRGLP